MLRLAVHVAVCHDTLQVNTHSPVLDCVNPLQKGWDIACALDAYEEQGAPASKLVFGLATYGRGFRFTGDDSSRMRNGRASAQHSTLKRVNRCKGSALSQSTPWPGMRSKR
jgi:GH18 family chitinase